MTNDARCSPVGPAGENCRITVFSGSSGFREVYGT